MHEKSIGENDVVFLYLKRIAASGDIPHALLFYGSNEATRKMYAMEFIKSLHCSSLQKEADPCNMCDECLVLTKESQGASVHTLFIAPDQDNNEITIPKIRSLHAFLARSSWKEGWKTVLIEGGDRLNRESAGALLKIFEEPRGKTCMIMLAERLFLILPTIRSRLIPVRFVSGSQAYVDNDSYKNLFGMIQEIIQAPFLKKMMLAQDFAGKIDPILFCDALILFLNGALTFHYAISKNQIFSGLSRSFKAVSARLDEEKIITLVKEIHALRRVQEQGILAADRTFALIVSKL